ncbi:MAG: TIGR02757 family protein, partial [Nitrospirae bacterium]|nr:TIGR02757 family protein [Nitrospirota bacterium]
MIRLKEVLDNLCDTPRLETHIKNDPIEFPHLYDDPADIELAGFIASSLAFGRIGLFKPVINKILSFADGSLYEYVINFEPHNEIKRFEGLYYRMCKGADIAAFIFILREVIRKHNTIGALFNSCYNDQTTLRKALGMFAGHLKDIDTTPIYGKSITPRGLLQLIPSPENGGPCKRLNMYLRWMVRPSDGIDFGLWKQIPPSALVYPLDTHIIRICKELNMTKRKSANWA